MTTRLYQDGEAATPRSIVAGVDAGDLAIPEAAALIELLIARETEALRADHARLLAIINTPQSGDFLRAVSIEAEHRFKRHGEQDVDKTPADWYWLIGNLAGKALHAITTGDRAKFEHHLITTAGVLMNWHRRMLVGAREPAYPDASGPLAGDNRVMKMTKATARDIEHVMLLADVLESISKGFYPSLDTTDEDSDDDAPIFFDDQDPAHLRVLYQKIMTCLDAAPGGLFRVVAGYRTIFENAILDADSTLLALHPCIVAALGRERAARQTAPSADDAQSGWSDLQTGKRTP